MNKVLVTGGLGFIGSHIVNRYVDMGWEVHCLDSSFISMIDLSLERENMFAHNVKGTKFPAFRNEWEIVQYEDNLKISNAGSDGQYLQKQSGNAGGLTWASPGGGTATAVATANDPRAPLIPTLASILFKLKTNLCKTV